MRAWHCLLPLLVAMIGCGDDPAGPVQPTDPLIGTYETVVWNTFRVTDGHIDLFAAGGTIELTLDESKVLSGAVHIPDSVGTDWDGQDYSFVGTYLLEGSNLTIDVDRIWGGIKLFVWSPDEQTLSWDGSGRDPSKLVLRKL